MAAHAPELAGREVFLSPHADDAVWSCGGRIAALAAAGRRVLLVTCFDGGTPPEPGPTVEPWRHTLRPALRRGEDQLAARALGVERVSLGLIEAGLRRGRSGFHYPSLEAVLGSPVADDGPLVPRLAEALRSWLRPEDRLHVPVAQGSHVDHVLVRRAAELLSSACSRDYYEEFPYPPAPVTSGLSPVLVPVSLEPWVHAGLCYRSQVRALFGDRAGFREALAAWASERGRLLGVPHAERYWSTAARPPG
jgi:LmbE family N-acetylglucosaminyl deacetylase